MILKDDPNLFVYLRKYQEETIIVIGSFSTSETIMDITNYPVGDILIHNYEDISYENNNLKLRPYETISYRIKE
ncbi:hypothetical protein [Acholeplasma laidlawii]